MGGAHLEGSESRLGCCSEGAPRRATPQLAAAAQIRAAGRAGWASAVHPAGGLRASGFLRPPRVQREPCRVFPILGGVCREGGVNGSFSSAAGDYGPGRHSAFFPPGREGTACEYPVVCASLLPSSFARCVPLKSSVTSLCRNFFNGKM